MTEEDLFQDIVMADSKIDALRKILGDEEKDLYDTLEEAAIYFASCGWSIIVTPITSDSIKEKTNG
jgi:hypothetical protein